MALMVIPYVSAEDTVFLTSTDNGAQPPELPNEILLTSNNEPPELLLTSNSLDNSSSQIQLLSNSNTNSVLSGVNLTKAYGESDKFEVTLKDSNDNPIIGQHVSINLTRLSSGANKVYDSVTDFTGLATLEINLAPGFYTAQTSFTNIPGFNYTDASTFNTITIKSPDDNRIPTVLIAEPTIILLGAGEYFNVTLVNENNTPVIGQHIALTLTRPSSGASKTYDSVTDYTGRASLQINLALGNYTARGEFAGQGDYASSMAATTITVVATRPEQPNVNPTPEPEENNTVIENNTNTNTTPINNNTDINTTPIDNGTVNPTPNGTGNITPPDIGPITPVNPLENNTEVSNNTNASEGALVVNGETLVLENAVRIFSSLVANQNSVLVGNGGNLSLIRATIVKMGTITGSDFESADLYGSNSAVLVLPDSTLNLDSGTLISASDYANGVFSTNLNNSNSGSNIHITNTRIDTHLDNARGLITTFGGFIEGDNLIINTRGKNSSAIKTAQGDGTIIISNSEFNTGVLAAKTISGSPLIYSMGDVIVNNSFGTAYQSQIAYLEGRSSLTLNNVNLTGYANGNIRSNGNYADLGGFFIYHSGSSSVDTGVAVLNATNSVFTIPTESPFSGSSPMFHVTNTEAIIDLTNCNLNFDSGILLEVNGQTVWGQIGNNGADVTFNAKNQVLNGNIIVDGFSSLKLNLASSFYSGLINPSSSSGTIDVVLDSSSTWTLTGDCYINSLDNQGHINYNGYNLYIDGVAYSSANPYI